MGDFDLSDALESSLALDQTGFECSSSDDTERIDVATNDPQSEEPDSTFELGEGLELVVTHRTPTLAAVAKLVLAGSHWKTLLTGLSDDNLCSTVMGNLVEETIVDITVCSSTQKANCSFWRMDSGSESYLCDSNQKAVIRESREVKLQTVGEFQLQAITLKGGNHDRKVKFKLANYVPATRQDDYCVTLSIINSNWHMSCSMEGDKAVLSLEEYSKESLRQITDESMKRFLFFKRAQGVSLTMFESVRCSGWAISTSCDKENQPVEMCQISQRHMCSRVTSFKMI